MRAALFAITLAGQAAAQTACPTAGDLATGILLIRHDPFFAIQMTQQDQILHEARVMNRGEGAEAVSTTYAHPLAVAQRIGQSGTLEVSYRDDMAALDRLPSLREWSTDITLGADGEQINSGTFSVRILGFGQAEIGGCTYDVWRVRDNMQLAGQDPLIFEKSYAPDLGLVLSSVRMDSAGNPVAGVFFDEITAE